MNDAMLALRRLVATFAAIASVLFIYTLWQSYDGRLRLNDSQIAGCERSKLDRSANAVGWCTAEQARRASGIPNDLQAADR